MNWLDIVIIVCVIIGLVKGYIDGIVRQIASVVALILAIILSGSVATWIRNFVNSHFSIGETISAQALSVIYYILAFLIIFSVLAFLANLVTQAIKHTPLNFVNRFLGIFAGVFLWMLCLSILINALSVFDKENIILGKQNLEKSVLYERTKSVFPTVYPYIKEYIKQ